MLITADVPTVSQITKASRMATYLSFVLYLDPALVADLSTEMKGRADRRRALPLASSRPMSKSPIRRFA